jgi:hypothetical protein
MTPYSNINERFLSKVQDYTLDKLFKASITNFEAYLLQFLKSARTKFRQCKTNLKDYDDNLGQFNQVLSEDEEEILAVLMEIEWLNREVKNVTDMRMGLSDSDFKRYSEAQNLASKQSVYNQTVELVDRMIVEYTFYNYPLG